MISVVVGNLILSVYIYNGLGAYSLVGLFWKEQESGKIGTEEAK